MSDTASDGIGDGADWGIDWLPVGEEPMPIGSITDCIIQRHNGISVVALDNGDVDAVKHGSTGIYHRDCRHLSRLSFSLGGVAPELLDERLAGPIHSSIFTNLTIVSPDGEITPARALTLRRRRMIAETVVESLTISNYSQQPARIDLRYEVDADFADIFEVRGFEWSGGRREPRVTTEPASITFEHTGIDGLTRKTWVGFDPVPAAVHSGGALYELRLEPRETFAIEVWVGTEEPEAAERLAEAHARVQAEEDAYLNSIAMLETDHEGLNQALRRALLDIRALRTATGTDTYLAAGVPWFDTVFGRDSLLAGMFLAGLSPDVLGSSLRMLAAYQATEADPAADAQPGKIPHELRWGELAAAKVVPFGRYYGSIDSTPLFLMALDEYLSWTGDGATVRELWPAAERAVQWCVSTAGEVGLLRYRRLSSAGLEHQGWKDSHDAVAHLDGRQAPAPVALVEVQAYLVAGLRSFERMGWELFGSEASVVVREVAERAAASLERLFADDAQGYVFALDGDDERVETPVSNSGHVLWAGAASPARASVVAGRMLERDLFSGWGVRTMGSESAAYGPLGYHTGSVWPHDNAMLIAGMRRYRCDRHALSLASAYLDAVLAFPEFQVPELYSGDEREWRLVPTPYPVASRPQAWSAASLPYVLMTLLGIRPGGPGRLSVVRPLLPPHCEEIRVRGLQCNGGSADLVMRRRGTHTTVLVEQVTGGLEIVMTDRWDGVG